MTDRKSLFKLSELPEPFGITVLILLLIFALAPYFSGADFGIFKIPVFTEQAKKWLKIIGPILLIACITIFLPLIRVIDSNKGNSGVTPATSPSTTPAPPPINSETPRSDSEANSGDLTGSASSIIPRSKYSIPASKRRINEVIIHELDAKNLSEAIETLKMKRIRFAYHYLIGRDGTVTRLIEERAIPWHTPNRSDESIAIGLMHLPKAFVTFDSDNLREENYPESQINSLLKLLVEISNRNNIDSSKIYSYQEAYEHSGWEMDITQRMSEIRETVRNRRLR